MQELLKELEALGLLAPEPKEKLKDSRLEYKFRRPNFDENGEPDF